MSTTPGKSVRDSLKNQGTLSRRDKFAVCALEGLLGQNTGGLITSLDKINDPNDHLNGMNIPEAYAWMAYRFADAMEKESSQSSKTGKGTKSTK